MAQKYITANLGL